MTARSLRTLMRSGQPTPTGPFRNSSRMDRVDGSAARTGRPMASRLPSIPEGPTVRRTSGPSLQTVACHVR